MGLSKIPSAAIVDTGKALMGISYFTAPFSPDHTSPWNRNWSISVSFGFHSRFDAGMRLFGSPTRRVDDSTYRYEYYIDRMFSTKFVLAKESVYTPQIAIGIQDMVGTRLFNSTYVVASKKRKWLNDLVATEVILGYGTPVWDYLMGPSQAHAFKGLFGGIQLYLPLGMSLMTEYDGQYWTHSYLCEPTNWLKIKSFYSGLGSFSITQGVLTII